MFELEQCLAFRRYKDKLTSLLNSMIQGAHSRLRTLEMKISSQPINQSLLAIKQIRINIRKDKMLTKGASYISLPIYRVKQSY